MEAYNTALGEVEKDLYGKSPEDTLIHTAQQVCSVALNRLPSISVNVCCIKFSESSLSISGCAYSWHGICYIVGMEEIPTAKVKYREH